MQAGLETESLNATSRDSKASCISAGSQQGSPWRNPDRSRVSQGTMRGVAASCFLLHANSPQCSATLAPCVPAPQLSCLTLPAAEVGLPGLQPQQPGAMAVLAPLRAGELLAGRAQGVV